MTRDRSTATSKELSWLLRHGALEQGLAMDAAGWARVDDVLRLLRIDRERLEHAVQENNKSRLQLDGARIRACQGHSRAGVPVTLEALEASWEVHPDTGSLWHGTDPDVVPLIAREGIRPIERTHVHLADATDSRVGKRAGVGVLLEVSIVRLREAGLEVFRSPNGVVLVRHVPPTCITGITALTARARAREGELRGYFSGA